MGLFGLAAGYVVGRKTERTSSRLRRRRHSSNRDFGGGRTAIRVKRSDDDDGDDSGNVLEAEIERVLKPLEADPDQERLTKCPLWKTTYEMIACEMK